METNARYLSIIMRRHQSINIIPTYFRAFCRGPYIGVYWLLPFPHVKSGQYAQTTIELIELMVLSLITRRLHFFCSRATYNLRVHKATQLPLCPVI